MDIKSKTKTFQIELNLGIIKFKFKRTIKEGKSAPKPRVSGFLCLGRLFQGQPNEAALCI